MALTDLLNDGFIHLVDSMGDDMSAVRAARVSYGKKTKGKEADKKLIDYLLENKHETPFEMITFTFHVRCPLFIARQWFRHRIGSFNEVSRRYTTVNATDFWFPESWRTNDRANKQSSSSLEMSDEEVLYLHKIYNDALDESKKTYEQLIEAGVAREQARAVLPMAAYTEFYWSVNARSLFNFLRLRMHESAQEEIQVYANRILEIVKPIAPWTFECFDNL